MKVKFERARVRGEREARSLGTGIVPKNARSHADPKERASRSNLTPPPPLLYAGHAGKWV